jgi:hypothetical protein
MKKEQSERRAVEALFNELIGAPGQVFPRYRAGLSASKRRGVYVIYDRRGRVARVGRTPKAKGGIALKAKELSIHARQSRK